jgi:hypothetical protein
MQRRGILIVTIVVIVSVVGIGWIGSESARGATMELTGKDYAEIERLFGLYNQGSDFRDAEMFVSAFSEDGEITRRNGSVKGQAALLAERAERYQGQTGDNKRRHLNSSFVITPTSDGAKGRAYWVLNDVSGSEIKAVASGYYDDIYVKTSDGWKIKSRRLTAD